MQKRPIDVLLLMASLGATASGEFVYTPRHVPLTPKALVTPQVQRHVPAPQHYSRPVLNRSARVGRNDPCPCNSGRKFKRCCSASVARFA